MAATRHIRWLATTLLAASLLGACSGSDAEPTPAPTPDAPSSTVTATPPDPEALTPEEREVFDAVEAYSRAVIGRGDSPIAPAIEGLTTPEVYTRIVASESELIDDAGRQYIGEAVLTPTDVTIAADLAVVKGCRDGSAAYIVDRGDTAPGVGSQQLGYSQFEYGMLWDGNRWLVAKPDSTPTDAC